MPQENEYVLSPVERQLISEIDTAKQNLEQQKQGALQLIMRTHGFEGTWSLIGDKLVKQILNLEGNQ